MTMNYLPLIAATAVPLAQAAMGNYLHDDDEGKQEAHAAAYEI